MGAIKSAIVPALVTGVITILMIAYVAPLLPGKKSA